MKFYDRFYEDNRGYIFFLKFYDRIYDDNRGYEFIMKIIIDIIHIDMHISYIYSKLIFRNE